MKESEYDVPFSTRNIRIHRLDWLGMDGPNCRSPSVAGDGHSGPADGALNVQCGPSTMMMYIYMFLRISFFGDFLYFMDLLFLWNFRVFINDNGFAA